MSNWQKWFAWAVGALVVMFLLVSLQVGATILWRSIESYFYLGFAWFIGIGSAITVAMQLYEVPSKFRKHGAGEASFAVFIAALCAIPGAAILAALLG